MLGNWKLIVICPDPMHSAKIYHGAGDFVHFNKPVVAVSITATTKNYNTSTISTSTTTSTTI